FGAHAGHAQQLEEQRALGRLGEAVQVEGLLAHVQVGQDLHRVAGVPRALGGAQGNVEPEGHAADVDDQAGGLFGGEPPAQGFDHAFLRRLAARAWMRWQKATASASAASAGEGRSRSCRCDCISAATWDLDAPPRPTAAFFTSEGAYSATGMPRVSAAT